MQYFTSNEYNTKYKSSISEVKIEEACEMIYAQVSQIQRGDWNAENVPTPIKNASMEQARFLLEQDIPHVDTKEIKSGSMSAKLQSEYSTLALTILSNNGYLYRGSNPNFIINIPIGE